MRTMLLISVLFVSFCAQSARASTVHLRDGQSVEGCIVWSGRAGVTVLLDCNPYPYFAHNHEVFIDAERIEKIDWAPCVSAVKPRQQNALEIKTQKGEWAAEARKADVARKDQQRLAAQKAKSKDELADASK